MLSMSTNFSKKHYAILGRLVLQKDPETAHKLMSLYLPEQQPTETDLSKINSFFTIFCELQDINPEDLRGPVYKSWKVDTRRKFVAAMVHLYYPQAFLVPMDSIDAVTGLVKNISIVLKQDMGNTSKMIRQAVIWEGQYEDFERSVKEIIEKLSNGSTCRK
jgi:hypothetical protein